MSTAVSPHLSHIEKLLHLAQENGATEVRLSAGYAPMLRVGEQMRPLKTKPLSPEDVLAFAAAIMPPGADPRNFSFKTAAGPHTGSLLEIQGSKVLVMRASSAAADQPESATSHIELDMMEESGGSPQAGGAPPADTYAMPKAAVGTLQGVIA